MDDMEGKNQHSNIYELETFKLNHCTHFAVDYCIENNGQRKH